MCHKTLCYNASYMYSLSQKIRLTVLGVLGVIVVVLVSIGGHGRGEVLTIAFLDVGQGDGVYIEAPNGNQVLIDGGATKKVLAELGTVISPHDRSIDVVMATHPDLDHIGGLVEVIDRFEVDLFIEPGVSAETAAYEALQEVVEREGVERLLARRGMRLVLDHDVVLDILFPDRDLDGASANDASIVARLSHGEVDVMLTGDAPRAVEAFLVALDGALLEAEVLKVGHHGSKTSTADEFLEAVSPHIAVISAGADNRYGHPHDVVVDRIIEAGVPVVSTAQEGTIVFQSDGMTLTQK